MSLDIALACLVGLIVVVGAFLTLLAAIGVLRLPDLMTRMHAASKAGASGGGLLLLAAGIDSLDWSILARAMAGVAFILLSTPVSAHLLAKAVRDTSGRK